MNKPTIGYLTSLYPAASHTFIFDEIQSLRRMGIAIKTATIRPAVDTDAFGPAQMQECKTTNCVVGTPLTRIVTIHGAAFAMRPMRYLGALRYAFQLRRRARLPRLMMAAYFVEAVLVARWMREEGIKHLHVHFGNPAATVALIAKRLAGIRFSLSIHGPDIFDDVSLNLLAEKIQEADFSRCISRYCRSQSCRLIPYKDWVKLQVVRCGVDTELFDARPEPGNAVPRVLCVGRLVPAKGQHVLMEACALLRGRGIALKLSIIGDGPDRLSLEEAARNFDLDGTVAFMGMRSHEAVCEELARTDLLVLPSFAEGIPVVLMEAMAREVPCISTPVMGIPELIRHGENGYLANTTDPVDLADKIQALIDDPPLRHRLGVKARETILREYNLQDNCRQLRELFARWNAQ